MAYCIHYQSQADKNVVEEKDLELKRFQYQFSLESCIESLRQSIELKQQEIKQGANVKQNILQLEDLQVELDFHLSELLS